MPDPQVHTGLDVLIADGFRPLAGRRVGLLTHPAAVDRELRPTTSVLAAADAVDLRCLFGPQHGLRGETQDNMIEWEGFADPSTGLPVHSLYGDARRPTPEMLAGLDTLVVDLQDVGARYYTFIWTLLLCLEACADAGVRVVVLDRPNPLGGVREGNLLDMGWKSFVGLAPIPMRHGLTIGELAVWFRAHFSLDVELEVIRLRGWTRRMHFADTGLPWILPSPNMPTPDTALVYPGACLLEGTELSEGRGTTRPFEILGAPFIRPEVLARRLGEAALPGMLARPLHFEPTFQKHAGNLCGGIQVHVTDREAFRPVLTYVTILSVVLELWPEDFAWRQPPYEYEEEKLPIDILAGGDILRRELEAGRPPGKLLSLWQGELADFDAAATAGLYHD